MNEGRHRLALWTVLGLLVAALAVVAAGCGGGDDEGSASAEIEGLGTTLEEIQANAKDEGQVDLIAWAGYLEDDWVKPFEQQSGCKVNAKIGTTSDEMVTLMRTGNYDGVSASGDATLRLIAAGDVAPVNLDLIPNYENVFEGLKDQPHNTVDGVRVRRPARAWARTCCSGTRRRSRASRRAGASSGMRTRPAAGKISIYDSPIYIADAAVYLMATQPDLEITNPYELDETQFNAAVDLLKQQKAGEYWSDCREADPVDLERQLDCGHDVAVPAEPARGREPAGAGPGDAARGGLDRLVGHLDDRVEVEANPNCMYLWMDYIISPEGNAKATEYFGEAPVSKEACGVTQDPDHCAKFHATDEDYFSKVYYWNTPMADCGDDRGEVCKDYSEWTQAWTEIRG